MINYSYLRPQKAAVLQKWHTRDFVKRTDLECYIYDRAIILPVKRIENENLQFGHGGVIAKGQYITSSGIEGRVGGFYSFSEVEKSDLTVVYCGYLVNQWGHFLIESVARLWYALDVHQDVDKYVFITKTNASTKLSGNYREFFDLLGIWDKIEIINQPIEYKKVIIPELGFSRNHYYSEEYCRIFDKVVESALKRCALEDKVDSIFLSRGLFAKAKQAEAGLEMLDNYFKRNGFKIIYPECISLSDMIYYIQKAEIYASESGTLPHNLLFAQQGKKCIVIERQTIVNEIQANIDLIKDLSIVYIDGHLTIYPVSAGYGPFYLAYNKYFREFTSETGYKSPEECYCNESYMKKCLRKYFGTYSKENGYRWGIEPWMLAYIDSIYEAYEDSLSVLDDFLSGNKPFMLHHYFQLNYWKRQIKRLIKKGH